MSDEIWSKLIGERPILAPSILSADFWDLGRDIREVEKAGIRWLHIDVMDGHFVPNITIGPLVLKAVSSGSDIWKDVHLMIEEPGKFVEAFSKAGADLITIHYESSGPIEDIIHHIRKMGRRVGLSINPDTPAASVGGLLPELDLVLVMSVHPGFGGQRLIPETLDKIRQIKAMISSRCLDTIIEVDGGVNPSTIHSVLDAGADVIVAGSAIFNKAGSVEDNIRKLRLSL